MTTFLRRGAALIGSVLLAAGSLVGLPLPGQADTTPVPTPPPSGPTVTTSYPTLDDNFALTVSPSRLIVSQQDIGTQQQMTVVNQGANAVPVVMQKRGFTAGLDGSLTYDTDAPYAATNWVTVTPDSYTLQPGTTQVVTVTITPPTNPEPGDHQVAIVFLVPSSQSNGNIKINRGIATPMFITVPGPIDDSATVADLEAPGFVLSGPVTLSVNVTSTGTVHRDFRYPTPLTVGGAGSAAAFPDFTVPRGSSRDISTTWDPPLLCVCHPSVSFVNADGVVQTAGVRVIVFPIHLVAILIIGLLLLWLLIRFGRRRYRASVASAAAGLHARTSAELVTVPDTDRPGHERSDQPGGIDPDGRIRFDGDG